MLTEVHRDAEKKARSWIKEFSHKMYQQTGMRLFILGAYQDKTTRTLVET